MKGREGREVEKGMQVKGRERREEVKEGSE